MAAAWALPFIDKDEILEALFEREGTGGTSGIGGTRDAPWRQRLSQAADAAFARQAQASGGAVLASWWRHPLSSAATGTPTEWLRRLPGNTMEVYCECSAATAVARFMARVRHPGHLDGRWSEGDLLAHFEQQVAFGALGVAPVVRVETGGLLAVDKVAERVDAYITTLSGHLFNIPGSLD